MHLEGFERHALDPTGLGVAVVAVTVCVAEGVPSFVLTRRASKMRRHAGQWALPGGRKDSEETAEHPKPWGLLGYALFLVLLVALAQSFFSSRYLSVEKDT